MKIITQEIGFIDRKWVKKMVDIHTHILPNLDDGSKNNDNSIRLLYEAEKAGFTDIVFTPHYMEGVYETTLPQITTRLEVIEQMKKKYGIKVNLHIGNEIYTLPDIHKKVINSTVQPLNGTRFVLLEFPMDTSPYFAEYEFVRMIDEGFTPILAHPERYLYVQDDITFLDKFLSRGVLLQSNYASLSGHYGSAAKRTIHKLIKNKLVTFMASDVHYPYSIYLNMEKYIKLLKKITTPRQFEQITHLNAERYILSKEDIQ